MAHRILLLSHLMITVPAWLNDLLSNAGNHGVAVREVTVHLALSHPSSPTAFDTWMKNVRRCCFNPKTVSLHLAQQCSQLLPGHVIDATWPRASAGFATAPVQMNCV